MNIAILIPTLNEEEGIGPTLDSVNVEAFKAAGHDVQFVIVDGNSKDATRAEAEARGATVIVDERRGYGRAYKTGMEQVDADIIVTGDADGTYPFDECHEYVAHLLENDYEFLTCNRYADLGPGAMSAKHRLGNWVLSTTMRGLFWVKAKDSQSGMWIIRKEALAKLPIQDLPDGMAFSQEIKIEALKRKNIRAAEIPGRLRARLGDAVIESWRDGFGNLVALVKKRFTTKW
ncbi:MAG: glycosyltransferase family 2 protein [Thermoplasmatota archaeon]